MKPSRPLMTLREMRERRGATMGEVADAIGVSRQTYLKQEKDPGGFTNAQTAAICDYLHCAIEDISDFFCAKE